MVKRKKLPAKLRRDLLAASRGACFAHRMTWIHRIEGDPAAAKRMPLDIHHVVFYSLGGDDLATNLVPLCPLCHRLLHEDGRIGKQVATAETVRAAWDLWCSFAGLDIGRSLGYGHPVAGVRVAVPTYGLTPEFKVDAAISYSGMREAIIKAVVLTLADADPYFAFPHPRTPIGLSNWQVSCDDVVPGPWDAVPASKAIKGISAPISLTAPVIVTLNRRPLPTLTGSEEQRTI